MEIRHYLTASGADPFQRWFDGLRDDVARDAVLRRLNRLQLGQAGSHRYCRDGIWELRIDTGPGYRIYYGIQHRYIAILLGGGSKRTQDKDIDKAARHWRHHRESS